MAGPPYAPVPSAPHVEAWAGVRGFKQWWIMCRCKVCGPSADWERPCSRPHMTNQWIERYVAQHWHR